MLPVTVSALRLPSDVMLLSAVSLKEPLSVPAATIPVAVRLPVLTVALLMFVPLILVDDNVARLVSDVMLLAADCDNAPLKVPPLIRPLTVRLVRSPIAVILG